MKKLFFVLLAAAVLLTLGCPPTEPEKVIPIDEYDFMITGDPDNPTGGINLRVPVEGFTITQGNEYTVTFLIEEADEDFFPSRIGGKLVYKEGGGDDKVLSGWTWSTPTPVTGPGTYRWTFKAGERNEDGQQVAVPATTPEGASQFFTLNAQDTAWKQYPAHYEFRIKGSITVRERVVPVGELTNSGEITLYTAGSGLDPSIGKGNIQGTELEKVRAASGNGAFLRFYITNCNVTQAAGEDGNAVGNVGNRGDLSDGTNPNPAISIPKGTPANSNFSFQVDLEVEVLLEFIGANENHLFVNMYDATCSKIELWEYK